MNHQSLFSFPIGTFVSEFSDDIELLIYALMSLKHTSSRFDHGFR